MTEIIDIKSSETPITDALINRVMLKFPGVSASAQSHYYEEVHQELAPLARKFEMELSAMRAEMKLLFNQCADYRRNRADSQAFDKGVV